MIDRFFTLKETAAAFSTGPLSIVTACAEGKLPCWVFCDGEPVALTPVQIAEAMKRSTGLIETKPGSISWYLGGSNVAKVPSLNDILFRESEVSQIAGFSYAPNPSSLLSRAAESQSKTAARGRNGHGFEEHTSKSAMIKRRITFEDARQRLDLSEDDFFTAYIEGHICGQVLQSTKWIDISPEQVRWARQNGNVIDLSKPGDTLKYLYPPSCDLQELMFLESEIERLSGNAECPSEDTITAQSEKLPSNGPTLSTKSILEIAQLTSLAPSKILQYVLRLRLPVFWYCTDRLPGSGQQINSWLEVPVSALEPIAYRGIDQLEFKVWDRGGYTSHLQAKGRIKKLCGGTIDLQSPNGDIRAYHLLYLLEHDAEKLFQNIKNEPIVVRVTEVYSAQGETKKPLTTSPPQSEGARKVKPAASLEVTARVLAAAKRALPGLDIKKFRARWIYQKQWNLKNVAEHLHEDLDDVGIGVIRNILSQNRRQLPQPKLTD